ncbi:MAG: hypothetical protein HUK08_08845 [Bacteroidaceae bacterium]|nr:hypothetical protein [Bacteroidaceae bacterium]
MNNKYLVRLAHTVSIIFRPFYLPLAGLAALFVFSTLSLLPLAYKLVVLALVWVFTVILPHILITLYHNYKSRRLFRLAPKERRLVPYTISIICYLSCYWLLSFFNAHHTIKAILVAALAVQMVCALINVKWKISTHTAAIGSFLGGLIAYSFIFYFNPIWWFCLITLIGGIIGSSRMILRQHTLGEIVGGYTVGFLGALFSILML